MLRSLTVASFVLAGTATMGLSQTFEPYGEAGGWRVLANTKMQGCLMEKRLEDNVDLQIGINKVDARGYMAVFAPSSLGIVPAGGGEMVLDIDGDLFTGEAVEVDKPDYVGGYFWFNNPDFIYDLENKEVLGLVVETGTVVLVNLEGTKAGADAVRQCQEEKFGS